MDVKNGFLHASCRISHLIFFSFTDWIYGFRAFFPSFLLTCDCDRMQSTCRVFINPCQQMLKTKRLYKIKRRPWPQSVPFSPKFYCYNGFWLLQMEKNLRNKYKTHEKRGNAMEWGWLVMVIACCSSFGPFVKSNVHRCHIFKSINQQNNESLALLPLRVYSRVHNQLSVSTWFYWIR